MRRLLRFFGRAEPEKEEILIFRGILKRRINHIINLVRGL